VEGPFYDTKNSRLAITGGTGAYSHARGWMQLNSLAGGTQHDFIFHLIG
jgi:allene oxide cyclase